MDINLASRFINYSNRVYDLNQGLNQIEDKRIDPYIPTEDIILSLLSGIVTRVPSFLRLEARNKKHFSNILTQPPSDDALGYGLMNMGISSLRSYLNNIVNTARYNKVFQGGTIDGLIVGAIDGSQIYSTEVPQEEEHWKKVEKEDDDQKTYWHMDAVALSYVGDAPPLLLNMDRIEPGEGETTAAKRMLEDSYHQYHRYCDVLTMDALYAKAPVIEEAKSQNKDVVIRVKQKNYNIIEDIEGLIAGEEPTLEESNLTPRGKDYEGYSRFHYDIKIWDCGELTSWESYDESLRCLKIEETKKEIKDGELVKETQVIYLVTTLPKEIVKPLTIWKIAHRRWDIENNVFHDLKSNWNFDHCYIHEPHAILVLWLIFAMAFNLLLLFVERNLRLEELKEVPNTTISEYILADIIKIGYEEIYGFT
jgi:hypothetical protein